jgi:hypothetical protein
VKLGPLNLKEQHRLRAYEKRLLRKKFRPTIVKITGGWRRPHEEQLHALYISFGFLMAAVSKLYIMAPPEVSKDFTAHFFNFVCACVCV